MAEPQDTGPCVGIVVDCDVSVEIPTITAPPGCVLALVLVRIFDEPIGVLSEPLTAGGLDRDKLAEAIVREVGPALRERIEECGLSWTPELPADGLRPPRVPRFLVGRERVLHEGPEITAAICTRDRPEGVRRLLGSLHEQHYPRLRVLVIDNAPADDRTRRVAEELSRTRDIDYVMEPRPGLSWARNRALDACDGEIIAYVDDDAVCDPWWAAEVARGFFEVPEAAAVTGIIVPMELKTRSQTWYEQYSGVRRGRGFKRAIFSPATARTQSPLYPLPPWGSGGNMAFRRGPLERIGRFDCALGAGTATLGGEDTAALSGLQWAGEAVVYQPTALIRHCHRREYADLRRVLLGYGRGLGAYYASMITREPGCVFELLRLSGQAVRDQVSRRGLRLSELEDDFPRDLLRANRIGLLQGPFLYAGARLRAHRLSGMV